MSRKLPKTKDHLVLQVTIFQKKVLRKYVTRATKNKNCGPVTNEKK